MKKNLLIVFLVLIGQLFLNAAGSLPKEYYDLKSHLKTQPDDESYYWAKINERSKDLETVVKLMTYLNNYDYKTVNDEINHERRFVESAIQMILPITEYTSEMDARFDGYMKLGNPKREYYGVINKWTAYDEYIYFLEAKGIEEQNAVRIAKARLKVLSRNGYSEGKAEYNGLFKDGILEPHIIWTYFSYLNDVDKADEVEAFDKNYFKKMTKKQINRFQSGEMLTIMMGELKKKKLDKEFVNAVLDKINPNDKNELDLTSQPEYSKDLVLNVLCDKNAVLDAGTNLRVKKYLKNNTILFKKNNGQTLLEKDARDYILKNKSEIGLNENDEKKFKNIKY